MSLVANLVVYVGKLFHRVGVREQSNVDSDDDISRSLRQATGPAHSQIVSFDPGKTSAEQLLRRSDDLRPGNAGQLSLEKPAAWAHGAKTLEISRMRLVGL